jgi:hypothetical protein
MEKLSPKAAEMTRREWQALGFFYVSDNVSKKWQLTGSKSGLIGFANSLEAYASDPNLARKSEHEHFGPHMYLKVMTWPDAGIDGKSIRGTQEDIRKLATLIKEKLSVAQPGEEVTLGAEYVEESEYKLVLRVRDESFDPATEDPQLANRGG